MFCTVRRRIAYPLTSQSRRSNSTFAAGPSRPSSTSNPTSSPVPPHPSSPPESAEEIETDDLCIPLLPPWSVHAQLSASPSPTLSPEQLRKLHRLAALVPPEEGTEEWERLRGEVRGLVGLVEAVRGVDTSSLKLLSEGQGEEVGEGERVPDGRIWQRGRGMALREYEKPAEGEASLEETSGEREVKDEGGTELLRHARRTVGGYYVVEKGERRGT